MMYKLSNKQERQGKNGVYISATLTNEQGQVYDGVNAFHSEFAADTWHGELEQNGKFWNLITPKQQAGANFKTMQMEKVMDKKEQSIGKFQDNKEQSIKIASTMNQACQLAIAEYANPKSLYTLEELIEKWRAYLWKEWDNTNQYPPF